MKDSNQGLTHFMATNAGQYTITKGHDIIPML